MWGSEYSLVIEDPHRLNIPSSSFRYPFDSTGHIPYLLASARRKRLIVAGSVLSAFSLLLVSYLLLSLPFVRYPFTGPSIFVSQDKPANDSTPLWDSNSVLLGPPTTRFRDNLLNDTKYITSWASAGWTNDVMTFGNLIYLALLTERVPIIGPFVSSHKIGGLDDAGTIQFSEVFDIDYLSEMIGIPVLEWYEVKEPSSEEIEDIGCWSVWQAVQTRESEPRINNALELQGLDISFTAGPSTLQIRPGNEHDPSARFWDIASLLYSPDKDVFKSPQPSKVHGAVLSPDEQLACFDYLYYTCAYHPFEYERDISPAWRFVVRHFRWTERLQSIVDSYLRRIFGVRDHEPIPPYIAIHARRTDFTAYCRDVPQESCFPSIRVYQRRVAEIRREIRSRRGVIPRHVIMLSDEEDSDWWDLIRMAGWYTTGGVAEDAIDKYGRWYPLLIDAVIQSSGVGLIGTAGSTMSLLAGRRIQDWHNGVYKEVKWGTSNADDH
ncbi:hypothetical protein BC827DRAFT_343531 [Russula dissimulans]|nr:hypothetical protein BC827DRAFT_343531 [Russula dissimulans]